MSGDFAPAKNSPSPPPGSPSNDEKTWAMLAHVSVLFFAIFGPLIVMLVRKDEPFTQDQAKEALNFQLTALIANLVLSATCIGLLLVPIVYVGAIVFGIIAGMEANKGVAYRYQYCLRMVK